MSLRPTLAASKPYFSLSPETPTMLAMRKMKYPDVPADLSIFEEATAYSSHAPEKHPALEHQTSATVDLPALLVAEGKYKEATRILDELDQMHVRPRASQVFVDAALHFYRVAKPSGIHDQCTTFRRWYSLIPDASSTRRLSYSDSKKILDTLLGRSIVDLPLIEWYLRINISKGYFLREYAIIIRDFVTLSNRHTVVRLLDALWHRSGRALDAVIQLHERHLHKRRAIVIKQKTLSLARAKYRRVQMLRAVYSAAIDQLRRSNRLHEAVFMLQAAEHRGIRVYTLVLSRLVPKLEDISDTESLSFVTQLLRTRRVCDHVQRAIPRARAPSLDYHDLHEPSRLAAVVRALRWHVHAPTCPSYNDLVHVIDGCVHAGRLSLLTLLRKKAYRTTYGASKWAVAEMLFYLKQQDAPALGIVYGNTFRLVGVPRQALHYAWPLWAERPPTDYPPKSPLQRLAMSSLPQLKRKMWPSAHHTALVWVACVRRTKDRGALWKLYKELLTQVTAAQEVERASMHEPAHVASSAPEPTRSQGASVASAKQPQADLRGPSRIYQDAHFKIFIRAFGKTSPADAARVVADMYRLGIQPSLESMLALLRCFAAHNKRGMLLGLLKRMEAAFAKRYGHESSNPGAGATAPTDEPVVKDLVLPAPNIAAYLIVIEHLIAHHRNVAASHVARRMLKNLGYQSVTNTAADRVLRNLVLLLSDPRRPFNKDGAAAQLVEAMRLTREDGVAMEAAKPSPSPPA